MKCLSAAFTFFDVAGCDGDVRVAFHHDEKGKPNTVSVRVADNDVYQVENNSGRYKPCVTHCKELIRLATKKPPVDDFAKRRQKAARPKLKVKR